MVCPYTLNPPDPVVDGLWRVVRAPNPSSPEALIPPPVDTENEHNAVLSFRLATSLHFPVDVAPFFASHRRALFSRPLIRLSKERAALKGDVADGPRGEVTEPWEVEPEGRCRKLGTWARGEMKEA